MSRKLLLLCFSSLLLLVSCVPVCEETGSLVVKFVFTKAIPSGTPASAIIVLSKGVRTLSKTVNLVNQDSVVFQSIEKGVWDVYVELRDDQGYAIYVGQTQAEVIAGKQSTVSVPMTLNSADLKINVSVTSSQAGSVELSVWYSQHSMSETRNLQNGEATFEFRNLASAVWNTKLTVYDLSGTEMLVWPESTSVGLELQPGRMNEYSFEIDEFGNVELFIKIEGAQTVSTAILTNTDEGILISWLPVEGASIYEIYRLEQDYWAKIYEGSSTSFLDQDVVENVEYCYVFNVVSEDGRHSGFSEPFRIVRDTQRIFIAFSDKTIARFEIGQSQITPVASGSISEEIKALRTVGNDLYVLTSNSLFQLNAVDLRPLSSFKHNTLLASQNFSMNDEYLFLSVSGTLKKLPYSDLNRIETLSINTTMIDADRYVVALSNQDLHVIDPETLQILLVQRIENLARVFTRGQLVFVLCEDNGTYRLDSYTMDASTLLPKTSYPVNGDVRCLDASNDLFCVGAYNSGVYLGRIAEADLTRLSSTFPKAVKMVGNLLYVLYTNNLEIYSIDPRTLSVTQILSVTLSQNAVALFAD
ncbi:hypothetical protein AS159_07800 [Thermotoga sp. Ku-13t]|uniref:hypothetical protein n=1 Tax=Thermotoga sp. Ku-13t TaxID=1755813 RepID=UPI0013ED1D65|nr:hypothetical protein [Thermotoga sp. Ku-13t]KAF2957557.1 hypothetical protein AS159_07800 [Thermotoga sp. Ku-13t]